MLRSLPIWILFVTLVGCGSDGSQVLNPPKLAQCESDPDCDDGSWCNGAEVCNKGSCVGAPSITPPCDGECDETGQFCTYEITASFLASTFDRESTGDCLAVGPPATEEGQEISVRPLPDNTLVRRLLATAKAGDVITFSQLFRQDATNDGGQTYSCHFNVLLGQDLTLIETGFCQTGPDSLECTITFDGVVISDT